MNGRDIADEESSLIFWLLATRSGFIVLLIITGILSELNTRLRGKMPRKLSIFEKEHETIQQHETKEDIQTDNEEFFTPPSSPTLPSKTH